jgi:uncharacterized protein YndB with AHSA1/START domain
VGGKYLNCMRSPDGRDFWSTASFREIVEPERLVMTDSFADDRGNIVPAPYYGLSESFPLEMQITVTFEEHDAHTRLTLKHSGINDISATDRNNMQPGWSESFTSRRISGEIRNGKGEHKKLNRSIIKVNNR